jgi:hypothetical protein
VGELREQFREVVEQVRSVIERSFGRAPEPIPVYVPVRDPRQNP